MIEQQQSQINTNQQSNYDQNLALEQLQQEVCLNNHQLLELTYNDQKFYEKLKQFNRFGCLFIKKNKLQEALIYLNQAQKILQYSASCGKTIERNLIITTLNNQASLYQKAWEIQKAQSYIQAIIYNISTFFQNNSEQNIQKSLCFSKNILNQNSTEYQDFSISEWRKKSLATFYLQFCAVNSQNKNHENAFKSASKAVLLLKQICHDIFQYEKFKNQFKEKQINTQQQQMFKNSNSNLILYQLAKIKGLEASALDFQILYDKAIRFIALYIKRLQNPEIDQNSLEFFQNFLQSYKSHFQNYSIGSLMQINPLELEEQVDRLNLNQQITVISKHFKVLYLSVGYFILATEARFISTQKYTLDQNERKNSSQYKDSQIYHLISIIILTKYLMCESVYFEHIVNSFRNHYKVDILQDGKRFYENNKDILNEDLIQKQELFQAQKSISKNSNANQNQKSLHQEIENIQKQDSQIRTVKQIPNIGNGQGQIFKIQTQESQQNQNYGVSPKQNKQKELASIKSSKNREKSQNTATKKSHTKKMSNNILTKSQHRLQTHEDNKQLMTSTHNQAKNLAKTINMLTSRQKQNKKNIPAQQIKSSRSKKKSQYQFLQPNRKINVVNGASSFTNLKKEDKKQKQDTMYYAKRQRQSDYIANNMSNQIYGKGNKSRSKSKRVPTSNETERKMNRRKDSLVDLKKTKKIQDEYGVGGRGETNQEIKTSRTQVGGMNGTANHTNQVGNPGVNQKKLKNSKESEQKLKIKKIKSPSRTITKK